MDPYRDIVEFYDLEHDAFDDDVSFFANVVQEGPVLEVGCGTGRIVERLARKGLEVVGIDTSGAMLSAARVRLVGLANASVQLMSVQALSLPPRFRTVIWPLNVLWHLPNLEAQVGALRQARSCLVEGGLLVMDLTNPLTLANQHLGDAVQLRFHSQGNGTQLQAFSSTVDSPAEQLLDLSLWYDQTDESGTVRRAITHLPLRYTYRFELELMLLSAGFRPGQTYGSYDLEPYEADSPNLLTVVRAA